MRKVEWRLQLLSQSMWTNNHKTKQLSEVVLNLQDLNMMMIIGTSKETNFLRPLKKMCLDYIFFSFIIIYN